MKKILLVDDDALVLELYRKKLAAGGFEVITAKDGLEAVKILGGQAPDFIILDLMMPRLSGADVLRFIKGRPTLAKIPVAVLTNAFMSDLAKAANDMGITRAVVKGDCTPARMLDIAREILGAGNAVPAAPASLPSGSARSTQSVSLEGVPGDFSDLLAASAEFAKDPAAAGRSGNLQELCRQAHHLTTTSGLARCAQVSILSGALEALLFELVEKPQMINSSTKRTIATAVEFLGVLIRGAQTQAHPEVSLGEVLAVDDDPLANRIVLAALARARVVGHAVESPSTALAMLVKKRFELVLLDIEMPEMTGFELYQKLRVIPGYERTPVIYVTSHASFQDHAKCIGVAGEDLIAKPIFAIELAVKVVMHLIRVQLFRVVPAVVLPG